MTTLTTHTLSTWIAACAIALATLCSAARGQPIYHIPGSADGDQFGWSVSGAGDIDKDGFPDFIVGAPQENVGQYFGRAHAFSGKTGASLFVIDGSTPYGFFGYSVSDAGDVNKDGYADVIIGAPGGTGPGRAVVISGFNQSVLYTFNGSQSGDRFGASVSSAGDVDNDGNPDVIVGAPGNDFNPQNTGTATVYSGADGSVIWQITAATAGTGLGRAVSGAGDANRDGHDDFIIGAPYDDTAFGDAGKAQLFSGKTGNAMYTFYGDAIEAQLGWSVSDAGDVDQDNFADVIVGSRFEYDRGRAEVFSGVDGSLHHVYWGKDRGVWFGTSVAGVGDVDNDGFDDVIVGAPLDGVTANPTVNPIQGAARVVSGFMGSVAHEVAGQAHLVWFGWSVSGVGDVDDDGYADFLVGSPLGDGGKGNAQLFSGAQVAFATNSNTVSLATGGAQTMTVNAKSPHAGLSYWVLGTASGTTPGTPLGPVTLPLNLDPYMAYTVTTPNTAPLINSMGTLDAEGIAKAQFVIPAGCPPSLLGLTLHHAAIVFDATSIQLVTNPASITFWK